MRVDQKFNRRSAPEITVQPPHVSREFGRVVLVRLHPSLNDHPDHMSLGNLHMRMTPAEAIEFGMKLLANAHQMLNDTGKLDYKP